MSQIYPPVFISTPLAATSPTSASPASTPYRCDSMFCRITCVQMENAREESSNMRYAKKRRALGQVACLFPCSLHTGCKNFAYTSQSAQAHAQTCLPFYFAPTFLSCSRACQQSRHRGHCNSPSVGTSAGRRRQPTAAGARAECRSRRRRGWLG